MGVAARFNYRMSQLSAEYGTQVQWPSIGGQLYNTITEVVAASTDIPQHLPDGQLNAAWADRRIFLFSYDDFNSGTGPFPSENQLLFWPSNNQTYVIHRARPFTVGQNSIQWEVTVFRKPQEGQNPANPDNSNGAWN